MAFSLRRLVLVAVIVACAAASSLEGMMTKAGGLCTNMSVPTPTGSQSEADSTKCFTFCNWQIFGPITEQGCVAQCIEKTNKYSVGCAGCFGMKGLCTKTECFLQHCFPWSLRKDSPGCRSCIKETCDPAFIHCSGVTPTEGSKAQSAPDIVEPITTVESTVSALPEDEWTQPVEPTTKDVIFAEFKATFE